MKRDATVVDIRNAEMELSTTRELVKKQELQKKYTGSWIWRAVAALVEISPESTKNIKWFSEKLGVSLEEVVDAIEGLEILGIIERTTYGYRKILKYVYFSDRDLDPVAVLSDHMLISSQILSRLNPFNKEQKSFYRTGFVASNEENVKEFCLKIEILMKEFLEKSSKAKCDRVVAFSFSNVKMSRD